MAVAPDPIAHPGARRRPRAHRPRPERGPDRRRAPRRPLAPTPLPRPTAASTGSGSDVIPIIVGARSCSGAGRGLPPDPTQPAGRPGVSPAGGHASRRPRRGRRIWPCVLPAVGRRALAQRHLPSRLPLVVYLAGAAMTVALSFAFVLVADVRADAARPRRGGHAAAGAGSATCSGRSGYRLDLDRRPGHRRRHRATATSRRSSCGSTAGSGSRSLSALVGPVWHWLDPFSTIHDIGAAIAAAGSGSAAGRSPTTRPRLGRWPAVDRASSSSSGSSSSARRRAARCCSSSSSATPRSRWR